MTIEELQRKIVSETKTLNSRIRRLRKEDLPSTIDHRIEELKKFNHPFVTSSGFISASYSGLTEKQLQEKLRWIRGVKENTETVKEARNLVERKAKEWQVKKEEAKRRIRAGRLFYQILGEQGYKWDSTEVHEAIQEFEETPSYDELHDKLMEKFGHKMQDTLEGREILRKWMNEKNMIPWSVYAHKETNPKTGQEEIIFDDEHFDEDGNIIMDDYSAEFYANEV